MPSKKPPRQSRKPTHVDLAMPYERTSEIASIAVGFVPVLGGAVSSILSGALTQGRFDRIAEELKQLKEDIEDHKDKVHEEYVKSEEFEELLAQTLEKVSKELDPEKRKVYRNFVVNLMTENERDYGEQQRLLEIAGRLSPHHLIVLRAFRDAAPDEARNSSSLIQTLVERTGMHSDRIHALVGDLREYRLLHDHDNLTTMMTADGAARLRSHRTPRGEAYLRFMSSPA